MANPERHAARCVKKIIMLSDECRKLLTEIGRKSNEIMRFNRELEPLGYLLSETDVARLKEAAARIGIIAQIINAAGKEDRT